MSGTLILAYLLIGNGSVLIPRLPMLSDYNVSALPAAPIPGIRRLGRVTGSPQTLEEIQLIVRRIQEMVPVDGYFFDFSNLGAYYFLAERQNPTRFGLVNYIHGADIVKIYYRIADQLVASLCRAVCIEVHGKLMVNELKEAA